MNKPKLYVSSTFFDLEPHREALIQILDSTQCFDLYCMEKYGTRSVGALPYCTDEVKKADIYILLLGHRYGYIPEGEKYSITHLEYKAAIGDADMSQIAGKPDRKKIVLPFILDENYRFPDDINKQIAVEEERDGLKTTKEKKALLQAWKDKVGNDFLIHKKRFTTPNELPGQVLAALIYELKSSNNMPALERLRLPPNFVNRCNRERPRLDFRSINSSAKDFYRLFFIHGDTSEMPLIFSNNLSTYELPSRKEMEINNLANHFFTARGKFEESVVKYCHAVIFNSEPESLKTFKDFADAIIKSDISMVVVKMVIDYSDWHECYDSMITPFLKAIKRVNKLLGTTSSAAYLLINIRYFSAHEKIASKQPAGKVLEQLKPVKPSDVDEWVRTYFYQNTRTTIEAKNDSEMLIENFRRKYFPEFETGKAAVNMFDTIKKLQQAVEDFNSNQYKGIFNQ